MNDYLAARRLKRETARQYRTIITDFVDQLAGRRGRDAVTVDEVTGEVLRDYRLSLVDRFSEGTQHYRITAMRSFLGYCAKDRGLVDPRP